MKKIIAPVIAFFLVAACNNNKAGKKNSGNREKDDYSKSENGDLKAEKKTEEKTGNDVNDNTNTRTGGWPQAERDGFITNCVQEAIAKGSSRLVAQNYCDCMLNKMEILYPDIQDLAGFKDEDFETPAMKKMAADCLKRN